MLGVAGVIYTVCFMALRAFDGSYALAAGAAKRAAPAAGRLLADVPANLVPVFGARGMTLGSSRVFVLLSMLGTAYMAHFNAPSFFNEIGRSKDKFRTVVGIGFGGSVLLSAAVMGGRGRCSLVWVSQTGDAIGYATRSGDASL